MPKKQKNFGEIDFEDHEIDEIEEIYNKVNNSFGIENKESEQDE